MSGIAPPVPYFGGKQRIADQIIATFPSHQHYVEPYCGGLSVLLAKRPSRQETVNDLDERIITFWRVLRDHPGDLERVCSLTPHSRAEYAQASDTEGVSDIEVARRVWIKLTQGRAGMMRPTTGWRYRIESGTAPMPDYLRGYVGRMPAAAKRLIDVTLEARPALEIIERFGESPSVLLYVDPPYVASTRPGSTDSYGVEMASEDEHIQMLTALRNVKASVVLSGYATDLYDDGLQNWHRLEIATATGQGSVWADRTEVLWSNREIRRLDQGVLDFGDGIA